MIKIDQIATFLGQNMNAESVLCYGSYAQGLHDDKSDIDLLILSEGAIPSHEIRQKAYSQIPDLKILELDKKIGQEWDSSWTPVNDRLQLHEQLLEIGYNTKSWVECVIDNLINKKKITFDEFAFRPYTFLGLLESSLVLYDKADFIKKCLSQIRPIPVKLKHEIIASFLPSFKENLQDLEDTVQRNIGILTFLFYLERSLDGATSLLFIINDVYDPASKRPEPCLIRLNKQPDGLQEFLQQLLPRCHEKRVEVTEFLKKLLKFVEEQISKERQG